MEKKPPSSDFSQAEFVSKNNYFELHSKKQIYDSTIRATLLHIFKDKVEREFLEVENIKPLESLRYIDDISFILSERENKLEVFLQR